MSSLYYVASFAKTQEIIEEHCKVIIIVDDFKKTKCLTTNKFLKKIHIFHRNNRSSDIKF